MIRVAAIVRRREDPLQVRRLFEPGFRITGDKRACGDRAGLPKTMTA